MATRDDFWLQLHELAGLLKNEFSAKHQTKQLQEAFSAFPESVREELCADLKTVVAALNRFDERVQTQCDELRPQTQKAG
jgi:hypothetical protein